MKTYMVTQVYNGLRDYQHVEAESREEAIRIASEELEDPVNERFADDWFAEEEEEDD